MQKFLWLVAWYLLPDASYSSGSVQTNHWDIFLFCVSWIFMSGDWKIFECLEIQKSSLFLWVISRVLKGCLNFFILISLVWLVKRGMDIYLVKSQKQNLFCMVITSSRFPLLQRIPPCLSVWVAGYRSSLSLVPGQWDTGRPGLCTCLLPVLRQGCRENLCSSPQHGYCSSLELQTKCRS